MTDLQTLTVTDNIVVSLDYTLTVEGEIIDSTQDSAPIEYIQGQHNILAALERGLLGLGCGESKQIFLTAEEGYGAFDPDAFAEIDKAQFPPNFELHLGRTLRVQDDHGVTHIASISEIKADSVRLNLNHPLAGKDLLFNASVVGLRLPTDSELANGQVGGCSCSSDGCGSGGCGSDGCGSSGCC